jgi:two-component system, LytTR family, sensor kinase
LQIRRFRIAFFACFIILGCLHAMVLSYYGFTTELALCDSAVSNVLLAAAALLVSITLQYYNPVTNRFLFLLGLVSSLTIIWILVSRGILMLTSSGDDEYRNYFSRSFILRFIFGFLVNGCVALVSVLWYTVQEQQEFSKRRTEAEKLSKEAELFKLRQNLQPHFLFNSLNSINALIGTEPKQARTMIQQLSDFLRGTLKKEDNQWVSLDEELQHLHLYLDIEKVRFGHRLATVIENTAGEDSKIPALLLQPIVENAIKFGLYDTIGDVIISLSAWNENNTLKVQVKNPFDAESNAARKGTGFGLSSVQRRLYLLFNRSDLLQTSCENEYFITTITIPQ